MTLRECYAAMGADFEDVLSRLRKEERIQKFLLKMPEDPSFDLLCTSMQQRDMETAFRAAHTMKGVSQNLSLNGLSEPVCKLTELLRGRTEYSAELEPAFTAVQAEYGKMLTCLNEFKNTNPGV